MPRDLFETSPFFLAHLPRSGSVDWKVVFGTHHAIELEIGFGNGKFIASMAAKRPKVNFVGMEIYNKGILKLLRQLERENLSNVRVLKGEAKAMIPHLFGPGELSAVYVNFPDPWPKKRHRKRRLIQQDFVKLMAHHLEPGGVVHLATDFEDYGVQMWEVFSHSPEFINLAGEEKYLKKDPERITTKYEERFLKIGQPIYYLAFQRK